MLSPEEHQERLRLYNQGLTDGQIGAQVCVTKEAIYFWRRKYGIPANFLPGGMRKGGGADDKRTAEDIQRPAP